MEIRFYWMTYDSFGAKIDDRYIFIFENGGFIK